jgi:predicted GH43/DUF377 family glycosyl hydrolase
MDISEMRSMAEVEDPTFVAIRPPDDQGNYEVVFKTKSDKRKNVKVMTLDQIRDLKRQAKASPGTYIFSKGQ